MGSVDVHVVSHRGRRPSMEDRHWLSAGPVEVAGAIFDGHSGAAVAGLAAARIGPLIERGLSPAAALRAIHLESQGLEDGACAVAFRLRGARLEVANVGDAELAVVEEGTVRVLTEAHRLDLPGERARVLAAGAVIDGPYAIDPTTGDGLMPTRSLGDHAFSRIGIIGDPHEAMVEFGSGWLVAACDGLWDVLAPDELPAFLAGSAREAAERLAEEALETRGSSDNLTIIAVRRVE